MWAFFSLRREGSNLRPSGYEPDELPLLYFAMYGVQMYGTMAYQQNKKRKAPEFPGPIINQLLLNFSLYCWSRFYSFF